MNRAQLLQHFDDMLAETPGAVAKLGNVFLSGVWHPSGVRDVWGPGTGGIAALNLRLLSGNPPGWGRTWRGCARWRSEITAKDDPSMNRAQLLEHFDMLAEQQRIVAKVDELMRWCDALEGRLTAAQNAATALLNAILHKILKGVKP